MKTMIKDEIRQDMQRLLYLIAESTKQLFIKKSISVMFPE